MSLGLKNNHIDGLKSRLAEDIHKITITNNLFVNYETSSQLMHIDKMLPQKGDIFETLSNIIGENPFTSFVYSTLSDEIQKTNIYENESGETSITSLAQYSDTKSLANRLVDDFNSLPWAYTYHLQLPDIFSELLYDKSEVCISNDFKLINRSSRQNTLFPLPEGESPANASPKGLLGLFLGSSPFLTTPPSWNENKAYLRIRCSGYHSTSIATNTTENFITTANSFYGYLIASGILKTKSWIHGPSSKTATVHIANSEHNSYIGTLSLPPNIAAIINGLESKLTTDTIPPKVISSYFEKSSNAIRKLYGNNTNCKNIIMACKWFFESHSEQNRTLSYIQSNIALEVLLGDKKLSDIIGIGELLSNRLAYLIGKSQNERKTITEVFKNIYTVRSKIVHNGKYILTNSERALFRKLQALCAAAICREVELID